MKRYAIVILVIVLGLGVLQGAQAEENEIYSMQLPRFKINVQGVEVDNLHNRNPILVYNGITYIPISYEYYGALSIESSWSEEKGLMINTQGPTGELIQDRSVNNDLDKYYGAVKPSFDVYLNGKLIDNTSSEVPILVYNSITYFPLAQEYLNDGLNIVLAWSDEDGLIISAKTDNQNIKDLTPISLNNEILEMAIRDSLSKQQGELTIWDLQSISTLRLSNKDLSILDGIEYLTNIEELYLDNNKLERIDKLSSLTNLRVLHLQRNFIIDISPLNALSSLEELSLNGNRVVSLDPLSNLVNLERLFFIENNITDIKAIKNLVNIKSLYMKYGNKIRDYSPIAGYYGNIVKKDFSFTEEELENMLVSSQKPLLNIAELIEEAGSREKQELKLNGFYAISSYDQFKSFKKNRSIKDFDSISFGWACVGYDDEDNQTFVSVDRRYNDFHIPEGYKEPIAYMEKKKIATNINIYASRNYDELFQNSNEMIDQILSLLRGKNKSYKGLTFEGVVIDFENLPMEHRDNYVEFLRSLDEELTKHDKNLIVAVSPIGSYDFGKIVEIADNVILMLHDYESKDSSRLSVFNEKVDNPNTPIERIKGDLIDILNEIDREKYISKLWLQINFAINQSSVSDGRIINQVPYTPDYEGLVQRIDSEINDGKDIEDLIGYSEIHQNPYIVYTEDQITSSIWYEDDRSVAAKIKLAKDLGLGGISLWRIGNIPDYSSEYYLDTWDVIREEVD